VIVRLGGSGAPRQRVKLKPALMRQADERVKPKPTCVTSQNSRGVNLYIYYGMYPNIIQFKLCPSEVPLVSSCLGAAVVRYLTTRRGACLRFTDRAEVETCCGVKRALMVRHPPFLTFICRPVILSPVLHAAAAGRRPQPSQGGCPRRL
jgi:hypothetical protein